MIKKPEIGKLNCTIIISNKNCASVKSTVAQPVKTNSPSRGTHTTVEQSNAEMINKIARTILNG